MEIKIPSKSEILKKMNTVCIRKMYNIIDFIADPECRDIVAPYMYYRLTEAYNDRDIKQMRRNINLINKYIGSDIVKQHYQYLDDIMTKCRNLLEMEEGE